MVSPVPPRPGTPSPAKSRAPALAAAWLGACVALGAAACGRDPGEGAAPGAGATPPDAAALRAELEAELRPEIERELRPRLRAEVEAELEAAIRARLERELATSNPIRRDDPDVRVAAPPDATSPEADAAPSAATIDTAERDDVWSSPGSRIWPSRGGFRLVEVAVGTGLEEKLPVNVKKIYDSVPELLYCYTVFENPSRETTVTHVWRRGTRLVSRVELEVGSSPRWKTWSKQRTQPHWTGMWSCEVLGPEGQQLGLSVFALGGT